MEPKPPVLSDLLLHELAPAWCRETVPLATGRTATLPIGTVMTVTGGVFAPVAAGTTNAAQCVLIEDVPTDKTHAVVVARGVVVARDQLKWPSAATDPQKTSGEVALTAQGILVRDRLGTA
jgi:hypothetical protein